MFTIAIGIIVVSFLAACWRYGVVTFLQRPDPVSPPSLDIPCFFHLKKGMPPGSTLTLTGEPTDSPKDMVVNLYKGTDIALHFNPRFHERHIVCNSKLADSWQREMRDSDDFPFVPRQTFTVQIVSLADAFIVSVDGANRIVYPHVIRNIGAIDRVAVMEHVKLTDFVYKPGADIKEMTSLK